MCVCVCLVCYFLPHISLSLPLSRSVAAVLVMAVCPWCKLAVGSQVAHMTVIDVQVFNSSHTETLEPHTHGNTCMHSDVVHVRTEYTPNTKQFSTNMHILSIPLSLLRKSKHHGNKEATGEDSCIQLPGCLASSENYQCEKTIS